MLPTPISRLGFSGTKLILTSAPVTYTSISSFGLPEVTLTYNMIYYMNYHQLKSLRKMNQDRTGQTQRTYYFSYGIGDGQHGLFDVDSLSNGEVHYVSVFIHGRNGVAKSEYDSQMAVSLGRG